MIAAAPATIAGLIEIRGIGIVTVEAIDAAPLFLIADLVPVGAVERMPERTFETILGVSVPLIALAALEASAAAKLRLLRRALAAGSPPAIIAL